MARVQELELQVRWTDGPPPPRPRACARRCLPPVPIYPTGTTYIPYLYYPNTPRRANPRGPTTPPSHHPATSLLLRYFITPSLHHVHHPPQIHHPQAFGVKSEWNDRVVKATEQSVAQSSTPNNPWIKRLEGRAADLRTQEGVDKVSQRRLRSRRVYV